MVVALDSSLLMSLYNNRAGIAGSGGFSTTRKKVAPTAPWSSLPTPAEEAARNSAAVKNALAGRRFIDEGSARLDLPGASSDYKKLFALYQGLSSLGALAEAAQGKSLASGERARIQKAFTDGLAEVFNYVSAADLDKIRLANGAVGATAKTTAPVPSTKLDYVTAPIFEGASSDPVPQFQGAVKFTIDVNRSGTQHLINVDLAGMGAQVRSMSNVVSYVNNLLLADGVDTRFETVRTPGQPRTTKVGNQTINLGPGADQWALRVVPLGETVSFTATDTAGAVYMAQGVGNPDPDNNPTTKDGVVSQQFVKFQTDTATVEAPVQPANDPNWVDGRIFAKSLGAEVKAVRATKVGPDGSVYMLADVTGTTGGQAIKGAQDVALLKYDAAGKLLFTRTLGASENATGLGLAIAADGSIAVAGSVSGGLSGAVDGALNSGVTGTSAGLSDSFVTVFNASGEELWTQRRGARDADEASQLTFGADGTVYVAGRAKSDMLGAGANQGDFDSYIEAFSPPDALGKVATAFTHSFGTAGADKPAGMVLDGTSLITATVENGRGVLRRFDVSGANPVLTATHDLGDLQGGDITGLALDGANVIVAGSTANAGLAGGTVTRAHAGGVDAFAAKLSATLTGGGGDSIAYYGGTGDDRATALSVAGGKVWIAGSAGTDLPGQPAVGTKDGFLADLDIATGAVNWSRRFTGKDGHVAPSSIAVSAGGASSLDRLGLPMGALKLSDSQRITAATSARVGDQFQVRSGPGRFNTVTIAADDTFNTLALKIQRATGFQAKITYGTVDGVRSMTIAPQSPRSVLEFAAGPDGQDALSLLGLPEGVLRNTTTIRGKTISADGGAKFYGLDLPRDLNLSNAVESSHAAAEVAQAMGIIRSAYKDLVAAADPQAAKLAEQKAKASGPVPAYLTKQLANYQEALRRLGG